MRENEDCIGIPFSLFTANNIHDRNRPEPPQSAKIYARSIDKTEKYQTFPSLETGKMALCCIVMFFLNDYVQITVLVLSVYHHILFWLTFVSIAINFHLFDAEVIVTVNINIYILPFIIIYWDNCVWLGWGLFVSYNFYLDQNIGNSSSLNSETKSKYGRQRDVGLLYSNIRDTSKGTQPLLLSMVDRSKKEKNKNKTWALVFSWGADSDQPKH